MRRALLPAAFALAAVVASTLAPGTGTGTRAGPRTAAAGAEQEPGPRYDSEGRLLRPADWQKWVLVGSSLGLGYRPGPKGDDPGTFKHVYINPTSFDSYAQTGAFPDRTMLILAVYESDNRSEPAESGWYASRLLRMEAAVKDPDRFAGGWGYFDLPGGTRDTAGSVAFPAARCAACHAEHAAEDNVFVQFYPVLRDARATHREPR